MRSALVARRRHAKKVGNVHCFVGLVQVTRIYIAVEETLLGFVLASKRVPRCKEEGVLYKRIMDRSGAPNDNFRKNICSEDDLRSRIFGTFVLKLLACLPLLGFSNI